jgi:AP-5 complex subunit, vesicle trafficking
MYKRVNSKLSGHFALEYFQFLLDHQKELIFDIEGVLLSFLDHRLSTSFNDPQLVSQLFTFLTTNHDLLMDICPSLYTTYYPSLLKPLAWFKNETLTPFLSLILPSIIKLNAQRIIN